MLKTILSSIKKIGARRGLLLDSIQIEVTSRCMAKCIMCPRTRLDHWRDGDLSIETFMGLSPAFRLARHVHLQGWGEPLLHPHLNEMVRLVKASSAKVGITTNGQLLNRHRARQLLELGLDLIAVSIAGADRKSHESIRVGTNFDLIIENLRHLSQLKRDKGSKSPSLVISFIMTRGNIEQLPRVMDLAAELGAERVSAVNVDLISDAATDSLRVFKTAKAQKERSRRLLEEMARAAAARSLSLRLYPIHPEEQPVCDANPLKNLFVSFDGSACPCVYLGLPIERIPRFWKGQTLLVERTCFGNIGAESLEKIWSKDDYRDFRRLFEKRVSATSGIYDQISCDFELLERAKELEGAYDRGLLENRPPRQCSGCWKLFGV
jgi:MoaA/NifB/PqqE/SkfB family radical SAM enzyme